MRADEVIFALTGTVAAGSFVWDYLWGLRRAARVNGAKPAVNPLVVTSALGITTLVTVLLLSVLLGWPGWVIRDAMGVLASVVFPFAQLRMRFLRRRALNDAAWRAFRTGQSPPWPDPDKDP